MPDKILTQDKGKVIIGVVIFLVIVLFPVWYSLASGGLGDPPRFDLPEGECVRDREYMRSSHMLLLDEWRDQVVRDSNRDPIEIEGKKWEKSLTKTCLGCHQDPGYEDFCLRCHEYLGVEPTCWDCHNIPEEN